MGVTSLFCPSRKYFWALFLAIISHFTFLPCKILYIKWIYYSFFVLLQGIVWKGGKCKGIFITTFSSFKIPHYKDHDHVFSSILDAVRPYIFVSKSSLLNTFVGHENPKVDCYLLFFCRNRMGNIWISYKYVFNVALGYKLKKK